jgi:hypothetical protein
MQNLMFNISISMSVDGTIRKANSEILTFEVYLMRFIK